MDFGSNAKHHYLGLILIVSLAGSTAIECTVGGNAPRNFKHKRGENWRIIYKSPMHGKRFMTPRTVVSSSTASPTSTTKSSTSTTSKASGTSATTAKTSSTTTTSSRTSITSPFVSKSSSTTPNTQASLFSQLVLQASNFASTLCSCIEPSPTCATSIATVTNTAYSTLTATPSVEGLATLLTATTTVICRYELRLNIIHN